MFVLPKVIHIRQGRFLKTSSRCGQDHYKVLGVDKDADGKEIKQAFYGLSKKYHPDMNPGEDQKKAVEQFQMVLAAYEILSNNFKRREYDQSLMPVGRGYTNIRTNRYKPNKKKEYTDINIDYNDFESFQKAARNRRGTHQNYEMPDEFFAQFGGRTFKNRVSEDDVLHTFNYKDSRTIEREREEMKIMEEIEEAKKRERYPTPTFEQLIQDQNRKQALADRKFNLQIGGVLGTILLIMLYARIR
uniref:J domain-containing protein n=1 Tax=Rhabditophanes sp. KR3021 TaxID=114890 RepID=A0AC35TIS5_9BILA